MHVDSVDRVVTTSAVPAIDDVPVRQLVEGGSDTSDSPLKRTGVAVSDDE